MFHLIHPLYELYLPPPPPLSPFLSISFHIGLHLWTSFLFLLFFSFNTARIFWPEIIPYTIETLPDRRWKKNDYFVLMPWRLFETWNNEIKLKQNNVLSLLLWWRAEKEYKEMKKQTKGKNKKQSIFACIVEQKPNYFNKRMNLALARNNYIMECCV